jgi:hypothetical protein
VVEKAWDPGLPAALLKMISRRSYVRVRVSTAVSTGIAR